MLLSDEEIRVLGCLVEKSLTTPQQYPLTEAAVLSAANQTTNRDPVVHYDQATVRRALLDLRSQGLARIVQRPGDRVPKHRRTLDEALDLDEPAVAVLAVLMLRGPQTAAELRSRCERLHPFASVDEVVAVLDALAARDEPLVQRIPRRPGQKEDRYSHLLQGDLAAYGLEAAAPAAAEEPPAGSPRTLDALLAEVAALREEVAALRAEVAALRGDAS